MFGPIPMFDPLTGGDARPPLIGNSTAANNINIDGSENDENNDQNEQTFETMNRAAL
jgi:hypothetical protein